MSTKTDTDDPDDARNSPSADLNDDEGVAAAGTARGSGNDDEAALTAGASNGPSDEDGTVAFVVSERDASGRLDKAVLRRVPAAGRRRVAELFEQGAVRVSGRVAKKGAVAREGDAVTVRLEKAIAAEPGAPLHVVLETTTVVVIEKPPGTPTVPARDGDRGTVASALLGRYPEMEDVGYRAREPGLLHRLDTETSGLLVAARSAAAFATLRTALSEGRIAKRYLAVVAAADLPESGVIETALGPDPGDGRRVAILEAVASPHDAAHGAPGAPHKIHDANPPPARTTRFRKVRVSGVWALVEVEARHAYRHQVRVHLASLGHPIAGDVLYGGPDAGLAGKRHALHASYVAWTGDDVVPAFAVESPLPADLAALGFPR